MRTLGSRIKRRREELGYTQEELTGPGLTLSVVSLIESDQTNPSLQVLELIAGKLGEDLNYLLSGTQDINQYQNSKHPLAILRGYIKLEKYNEAVKFLEDIDDEGHISNMSYLSLKGQIFMGINDYEKALESFQTAELYLIPQNINECVEVYYYMAECYRKLENYKSSIDTASNGLLLLNSFFTSINPFIKLKLLYTLSYSCILNNEFKKGLHIIDQAFNYMQSSSCSYSIGNFYMLKGLAHLLLYEYDKGIECTKKAIEFMKNEDKFKEITGCFTNLGIMYREIKEYDLSILFLRKSLQTTLETNQDWNSFNNYYELAITHLYKQEYALAESYCHIIADEMNFHLHIKKHLLLATIKYRTGLLEEALHFLTVAEEQAKDNHYLKAKIYMLRSKVLLENQESEEAYKYLYKAVKTLEQGVSDGTFDTIKFI